MRLENISKKDLIKYDGYNANIGLPNGSIIYGGKIIVNYIPKKNISLKDKIYRYFNKEQILNSNFETILKYYNIEIDYVSYSEDLDGGGKKVGSYPYSYILYTEHEPLDFIDNNDAFVFLDITD